MYWRPTWNSETNRFEPNSVPADIAIYLKMGRHLESKS